ncbi:hypothetical protein CP532_4360, partial [Ophiocordyceps camponoti-leonardi (nom. inval.)]
ILGLIVALPPVILVGFKLGRRFRTTPTTHPGPTIWSIPSEFLNFHLWLLSQVVNPGRTPIDSEMALNNRVANSATQRHREQGVSTHALQSIPSHRDLASYSFITDSSDEE